LRQKSADVRDGERQCKHKGEEQREKRRRCVELTRPRTPQPTGWGMTAHHLPLEDDDEPRRQPSPPNAVIDQLFERIMTLSSELE